MASTNYLTDTMSVYSLTTEKLNFFQRFKNGVVDPILHRISWSQALNKINKLRLLVGAKKTSRDPFNYWVNTLKIANTFLGFDKPRSLPASFKIIGPILSPKNTELSSNFKNFLQLNNKILYIAFGSHIMLLEEQISAILNTITQLLNESNINGVIWVLSKTEKSSFPINFKMSNKTFKTEDLFNNKISNIKIVDWAPQVALLNHKNVKIFWSHGGLESTFEAFDSGIKMLVTPFLGDQPRNAVKIEEMGIGKHIDKNNINFKIVNESIYTLLNDKDKNNLKTHLRIRKIMAYSDRRRIEAANLIEEFSVKASACRSIIPDSDECEMEEYLSVDTRMPYYKAYLWDVYFICSLICTGFIVGLTFICIKVYNKIKSIIDFAKKEKRD